MARYLLSFLIGTVVFTLANSALAQDLNQVAENITVSASSLPGLMAGIAYLSGVLIAVTGIFKTIEHVTSPTQTALRIPVSRFLIGGGLFSLPMVIEAVVTTIDPANTAFSPQVELAASLTSLVGGFSSITALGSDINALMGNVEDSLDRFPALIAATSYLLGTLLSISALYKTRDHIEDPTRVMLKDAVIRFLAAGALFAMPTVYEAMYTTIADGGLGIGGLFASIFTTVGFTFAVDVPGFYCVGLGGSGVDDIICNSMRGTISLPSFLTAVSYLLGLTFGVWAILKIRDHVIDPSRTALHEGISRLIAGGAFFAMPALVSIFTVSLVGSIILPANIAIDTVTAGAYSGTLTCGVGTNSLDEALGCFMSDVVGPSTVVLNFFCFCAGMIFVMIGISRLIKTAQEGARGPGGLGTITTFFVGGMLMSANILIRAFSSTFFGSTVAGKEATLTYAAGMSADEVNATYNIISAVLRFMVIVGMISFVRGIFIMRDVAEGKQQASIMAGMTHIVGGAFAVNLGPLMNAIQQTLGITAWGVQFT